MSYSPHDLQIARAIVASTHFQWQPGDDFMVDSDWGHERGPEWTVARVSHDGLYATYKPGAEFWFPDFKYEIDGAGILPVVGDRIQQRVVQRFYDTWKVRTYPLYKDESVSWYMVACRDKVIQGLCEGPNEEGLWEEALLNILNL